MKAIINCRIVTQEEILENKMLLFDEKILGIEDEKNKDQYLNKCEEVIDAGGLYVSPGFIDVHIHGSGGCDTMDADLESLQTIGTCIAQNGVTSFLPTTMTMSKEKIYLALDVIREGMKLDYNGAKILGAHMEGPFISKKYKGAQKEDYIVNPEYLFIKDYTDVIKIITMAPEEDKNYEFIREVKSKTDIVLSLGHTSAAYDKAIEAINNGISHATHTFNAMSAFNHREPGTVAAVLNSDVFSELIADKIHVHPEVFKILYKMKGKDRVILITDSMRAGCLRDGISELGGQKVIVKDNSARLEDGTLAGSILKLNRGVANFKNSVGISMNEAINMASLNPAVELGLQNQIGSIEAGKLADLIIIDDEFNVSRTIISGKTVFRKN
ncbi:N-acetylglucosamine-6-phosphate deacetylase [Clostridium oryzae]|uniref:N-acetylglucosamine-6-phosphate deacetylase n=1 Tax=Clostridium oryzae TaxID=1450648 RepID=A0A1V4IXP6_9CLOT|nr:N-acetylglucosamine-6-phosphate deacetylase [Clostridium oryzae]OPJ64600.1 N-acetylglucosamine-6-phosphate deacetylase [Clostridium oryzae]